MQSPYDLEEAYRCENSQGRFGAHAESGDAVGERNVQNDHDNRCEQNYEAPDRAAPQHHRTHNRRNGEDPKDYGAEYLESAVSSLGHRRGLLKTTAGEQPRGDFTRQNHAR